MGWTLQRSPSVFLCWSPFFVGVNVKRANQTATPKPNKCFCMIREIPQSQSPNLFDEPA
jgi:hypothetical protein